ncbi:MAG: Uncharacterised protein [Synechococcus sp. MIT S9220]|nr:MAG: Uncharacterised protein [Synechococcus sp. MIT S9220]
MTQLSGLRRSPSDGATGTNQKDPRTMHALINQVEMGTQEGG